MRSASSARRRSARAAIHGIITAAVRGAKSREPCWQRAGVCGRRRACNGGRVASRYAINRLRLAGPRWSVLLAGLRRPHRFVSEDNILTVAAAMSYYSPAGKMEGERAAAPVEIQAERIVRAGGSPA